MAHHFDAAGDTDVDAPGRDESADQVVGLLAGTALGVHGGTAGRPAFVAAQPGNARHVAGLLTRLGHAAPDHLLDLAGIDTGLLDDTVHGLSKERRGMEATELALALLALGDGGAQGLDDYGFSH